MFKESLVPEINGRALFENTTWLLVMDKHRFHVYVVSLLNDNLHIRIDWNRDSTLTFEKFVFNKEEDNYIIGKGDFSKSLIERIIKDQLKEYELFNFNCRTVAFLVLKIAGFKERYLYNLFKKSEILCGIDKGACLSVKELHHFSDYEEETNGCIIS